MRTANDTALAAKAVQNAYATFSKKLEWALNRQKGYVQYSEGKIEYPMGLGVALQATIENARTWHSTLSEARAQLADAAELKAPEDDFSLPSSIAEGDVESIEKLGAAAKKIMDEFQVFVTALHENAGNTGWVAK